MKIACRDNFGQITTGNRVLIELKPPILQTLTRCDVLNRMMKISGCILPGFDPIKNRKKDCQDDYDLFECERSLLCVLFDGHGINGHHVAKYCKDYMGRYFIDNIEGFSKNPKSAIEEMVTSCDTELKKSKIDTSLSGTTAIILYINSLGIHVGSVGDSRAILSTVPKSITDSSLLVPKPSNKYARPINVMKKLLPIALTVDHKPNHSQELRRIQQAGGEVRRIADELGNPIGPYRVWVKGGKTPGLGMSRAIGNKIASSIGVVSTPILNSFKVYSDLDQFIVIASDGLWDVMENIEVVNFVEKFRSQVTSKELDTTYPAKFGNSTIARLLCEEARFRWFGVLENEDVCVDDISCLVIELTNVDPSEVVSIGRNVEDRKGDVFTSVAVEGVVNLMRNRAARNDPTRGSMADEDTPFLAEALK